MRLKIEGHIELDDDVLNRLKPDIHILKGVVLTSVHDMIDDLLGGQLCKSIRLDISESKE